MRQTLRAAAACLVAGVAVFVSSPVGAIGDDALEELILDRPSPRVSEFKVEATGVSEEKIEAAIAANADTDDLEAYGMRLFRATDGLGALVIIAGQTKSANAAAADAGSGVNDFISDGADEVSAPASIPRARAARGMVDDDGEDVHMHVIGWPRGEYVVMVMSVGISADLGPQELDRVAVEQAKLFNGAKPETVGMRGRLLDRWYDSIDKDSRTKSAISVGLMLALIVVAIKLAVMLRPKPAPVPAPAPSFGYDRTPSWASWEPTAETPPTSRFVAEEPVAPPVQLEDQDCPSCHQTFGGGTSCAACGTDRTMCAVCGVRIWAGAFTCSAHSGVAVPTY